MIILWVKVLPLTLSRLFNSERGWHRTTNSPGPKNRGMISLPGSPMSRISMICPFSIKMAVGVVGPTDDPGLFTWVNPAIEIKVSLRVDRNMVRFWEVRELVEAERDRISRDPDLKEFMVKS